MEQLVLTCPFTGLEFHAFFNGSDLICSHPIVHEQMRFKVDMLENSITVPLEYFKHFEMVSPVEAAGMLDITRQRMTQLMDDEIIPAVFIGGRKLVKRDDVISYLESRTVGRPKKEE